MPLLNHPCDICKDTDKKVYERYSTGNGKSIPLMVHPVTKTVGGKCEFWCADCIKK